MEKEIFVLTKCVTGNERGATGRVEEVWVFDTFDEAYAKFEKESKRSDGYRYSDEFEYIKPECCLAVRGFEMTETDSEYSDYVHSEYVSLEIHKVKKGG